MMNYRAGNSTHSRRNVLKLMGAASAAALIAGGANKQAWAAPSKGGLLKLGLSGGSTTDSLDPATFIDAYMAVIGFALGNCLVEVGPDRNPLPELAESWESTPDAKTWRFKLRSGVTFHDGKQLTAEDVVWSLNRHIAADSSSAAKGFLEGVTSIKADGDTIVIEHSTGDADMPIILGDFHLLIVPDGTSQFDAFNGTGPYILETYSPGTRFSARRNPNYWKSERAWVDAVEILFIPDATARTAALMSGEVMGIDRVDTKIVDRLRGMGRYNFIEGVGGRYETSVLDVREQRFADVNIREALKFGVDRQAIVDKVFAGYASLGNDHPIPENDPFFHSELPQRSYDPDKAKFHLKQAGLDNITIDISTADAAFPGAVDAAVLMKEAGRAAGIDLNVIREPNDGYWTNVWMKKPYCMSNWSTRPTPGMMFSVAFACNSPWNESRWCDDHFSQLLDAGRIETDFGKRKQIYWDMQELVSKNGGNVIFAFPTDLDAYAQAVQGTAPDGVNRLMGSRVVERVWLS